MSIREQTNEELDGLDKILANELAEQMTAKELRSWCRRHGIVRKRGDSKVETAHQAMRQNPVAVTRKVLGTTPDRVPQTDNQSDNIGQEQ